MSYNSIVGFIRRGYRDQLDNLEFESTVNNFLVNEDHNSIDEAAGITRSTIGGGGASGAGNHIGREAKPVLAHPSDPDPSEWADDTNYPADGTAASVATIAGGYDNICNEIAGTISGGGHNYIKYNVNGHSVIAGGSYNVIGSNGYRAFAGGGTGNVVNGPFGTIVAGAYNEVSGQYAGILNGAYNDVSGNYSVASGAYANESGLYSLNVGYNNNNSGDYCVVLGRDGISKSDFAIAQSGDGSAINGDTMRYSIVNGARTTDDTLSSIGGGLVLSDDDDYAGTGRVRIIGIDEATHDVVIINQEFSFKMVAGTTTFFAEDGTAGTPGTAATETLTPVEDEITVGTCQLRATSGTDGAIIMRVTGVAATNIKWTGHMDIAVTRID